MDGGEEGAVEPSPALGDEFGDLLDIGQGERWQYGRKEQRTWSGTSVTAYADFT